MAVSSDVSSRVLLASLLSVVGGSTDIIGFLGLNGLFTSHITGNLVVLGAHVLAGDSAVLSYLLAVPVFLLVLLLTSVFAGRLERRGFEMLRPLLLLELFWLAAFLVLFSTCRGRFDTHSSMAVTIGMCVVAAMAVQTALVQIALSPTPATAVMTTNVTKLVVAFVQVLDGRDPGTTETARRNIFQLLIVIVGFMMGCALGAVAEAAWGLWSLGLPTMLVILAIGVSVPSPGAK